MPCIQQALSRRIVGGWTGWSTLALPVCRVTLRAYQARPGGSPCGESRDGPSCVLGVGTCQGKRKGVAVSADENPVMG